MMRHAFLVAAICSVVVASPAGAQRAAGDYPLGPDSLEQSGVRKGTLEGPFELHSKVFAGTVRRYWVYVPAGYDPAQEPNLLVFHDGQRATNPQGSLRIPAVLDNLIAKGDIPPTLGVFVTPGNMSERYPDTLGMSNPDHRWQEYDKLDDAHVRMLTSELLPTVARRWRFTTDPARRAIGGTSSGAIAAFTAAWRRPDLFGGVLSFIGSYTAIAAQEQPLADPPLPAGDLYPRLIRRAPIRPLKVFLQDGSADLDNQHGNWFLANQAMLAAMTYANRTADAASEPAVRDGPRYQVAHQWGDGGHSDAHGGAILPDALRWLWPKAPATGKARR